MTTAAQLQPYNFTIGTNFVPKGVIVTNVTNDTKAVVTTQADHGYSTGMIVSVDVVPEYGMTIVNAFTHITVLTPTTFRCEELDTSKQPSFVTPTSPPAFTQAQTIPETGVTFNKLPLQGPW